MLYETGPTSIPPFTPPPEAQAPHSLKEWSCNAQYHHLRELHQWAEGGSDVIQQMRPVHEDHWLRVSGCR